MTTHKAAGLQEHANFHSIPIFLEICSHNAHRSVETSAWTEASQSFTHKTNP